MARTGGVSQRLMNHSGYDTRADGASAFADGEAVTVVQRDRTSQVDVELDAVAGQGHFGDASDCRCAGHVSRGEEVPEAGFEPTTTRL